MELISKDEVMKLAESGKLLSGSFGERAKDIIESIPTIEERREGNDMGLFIKDMQKPKNCGECPLMRGSYCAITDNFYFEEADYDPTSCPLEEIDLVRCGECKWCDDKGKGRALICTNPYIDMDIHPLDFCSYGERRNDE